jgi:PIN domain nuclease of toxin-antitoxin system
VKFLLDTHFLLWLPIDHRSITQPARAIISDPRHEFLFSAASLWEIVLKRARFGGGFGFEPREIRRHMAENGYEELPINSEHAIAIDSLPPIHKNPFDRLLIAQAMVEGITLLTADDTIARYPGPIRKV